MSDLISRQDAIEVIEEMQMPIMRSMFPEEQFVFKGMSEALSAIKDLPSAQPEPSIEAIKDCRNCKHLKYNDYYNEHFCYNTEDCFDCDMWEPEDQEPYRAERRTDEGD